MSDAQMSSRTLSGWGPQKGTFVTYTDNKFSHDAAIITKVNPDGTVNLTVFVDGNVSFKKNVEEGSGRGQWRW